MAWEQIKARDVSDAPVTVAWVKAGGGKPDYRLRINIPAGVCSRLGFKPRDRVDVFRDRATGKVRLVVVKEKRNSYALASNSKSGALLVRFPLPELSRRMLEHKESLSVPHTEESVGGAPALVVKLPAWAAPDRDLAAIDRAQAAANAAKANMQKAA